MKIRKKRAVDDSMNVLLLLGCFGFILICISVSIFNTEIAHIAIINAIIGALLILYSIARVTGLIKIKPDDASDYEEIETNNLIKYMDFKKYYVKIGFFDNGPAIQLNYQDINDLKFVIREISVHKRQGILFIKWFIRIESQNNLYILWGKTITIEAFLKLIKYCRNAQSFSYEIFEISNKLKKDTQEYIEKFIANNYKTRLLDYFKFHYTRNSNYNKRKEFFGDYGDEI